MAACIQPSSLIAAAHPLSAPLALPAAQSAQISAFRTTFPHIVSPSALPALSPSAQARAPFRGGYRHRIGAVPARATAVRAVENAEQPAAGGGDPALAAAAWEALKSVRETRPLVHCITNFVSMDAAANTLLAAGAAPAMVHSLEEVEEFASLASALYVNIGTLSPDWVDSMKRAAKVVSARNRPWVLDPVGCGATSYRTKTSTELLSLRPTVVRGNASEVLALAGAVSATHAGS
ncbi:hypothetical protein CLOP_g18774 [Closterium sp. NIES-67]|nr:hypothetical protein CLOP_g18774 [Closterium sp. NIES-67]